jgi:hypothetical protein
MAAYGNKLAANFPGSGLYEHNGAAWVQLTSNSGVESMLAIAGKVYAVFTGLGLWKYDGGWTQLSGAVPNKLQAFNGKLAANFKGAGLFVHDGTAWTNIASSDAVENLIAIGSTLFADFGALGLYGYNGYWSRLTGADPNGLWAHGNRMVANFPDYGLYEYDGSNWVLLTGNGGSTDAIELDLP